MRNIQHAGRGGSISKRRGEAKTGTDGVYTNSGGIGGRESRRFPEIPTLPALVSLFNYRSLPLISTSMYNIKRIIAGHIVWKRGWALQLIKWRIGNIIHMVNNSKQWNQFFFITRIFLYIVFL